MARKKSRSRKAKASGGWSLSNNEYVGIVALIALVLIAAIVMKGPGLIRGESEEVAGQAIYIDAPADQSVDHIAPPYVPPEEGPRAIVKSSPAKEG